MRQAAHATEKANRNANRMMLQLQETNVLNESKLALMDQRHTHVLKELDNNLVRFGAEVDQEKEMSAAVKEELSQNYAKVHSWGSMLTSELREAHGEYDLMKQTLQMQEAMKRQEQAFWKSEAEKEVLSSQSQEKWAN